MKNRLLLLLTVICTLSLALFTVADGNVSAHSAQAIQVTASNDLTVDLGNQYRPVTHVASGSLYGLSNATTPPLNLIAPLKPSTFVQMAPNGQQLPNGETQPSGDALKVASLAARAGAKVTIRMPDIYPNFPYKWVSWSDWQSKVDTMVKETLASGAKNIYGYELWNEPNGTWNTAAAGSYLDGWQKTYNEVRSLDPKTPIIGPSLSWYDPNFMKSFLTYAKANNCLPDIISWHQWGARSLQSDVQQLTQLEQSLGIKPLPISINEYGWTNEEAVPGSMVQYIAQFERDGVQSANIAFWYDYGRLGNLITDTNQPNGGWWLYKWYGDMKGQMVMTTPSSGTNLDGVASLDAEGETARVIFGGSDGSSTITVKGFDSTKLFKKDVHVQVKATPWYGVDTNISKPTTLYAGTFKIVNGQITLPVDGMHQSWGYEVVITPADEEIEGTSEIKYPPQPHTFVLRAEAEDATINDAKVYSGSYASGAKYVGTIDNADSYVRFNVNVPTTGTYTMEVGYANGTSGDSTDQLLINGSSAGTVVFPKTGGWTSAVPNFGNRKTLDVSVQLSAGANVITLQKATSYAELDYLQLTKA